MVGVVFAAEQRGKAHGLQIALQLGVVAAQLVEHAVVALLDGHFADGHQVVPLGAELLIAAHLVLQLLHALLHLLAALDVAPEAVLAALRLQLGDLRAGVVQLQRAAQAVQRGPDGVQLHFIVFKFKHTLHIFNRFPKM